MTWASKSRERAPVVIWRMNDSLDGVEAVCDLFDAFKVTWDMKLNKLGAATFYLPLTDPMAAEVTRLRFAEIWEEDNRVELFRIDKIEKTRDGSLALKVKCTHVLDTLNDKTMKGIHSATGTVATVTYLLAQQDLVQWAVGTNDFAYSFTHAWTNDTIWRAFTKLPEQWAVDMQITFDTTSYPWTINVIEPPTEITGLIQAEKNLATLNRIEDSTKLVSRLYAYGTGAGTAQLTIASENVTGATSATTAEAASGQKDIVVTSGVGFASGQHVYIESGLLWEMNEIDSVAGTTLTMVNNLLATYPTAGDVSEAEEYVQNDALWNAGIRVTRVWQDQQITTAAALKDVADVMLAKYAAPYLTYKVKLVDLARLSGLGYPDLSLGTVLRLNDPLIETDVDARIVRLRRPDVDGKPGSLIAELTNNLDEFPGYGEAAYADNLDGITNGSSYGRILVTSISNGKIILSESVGDIDWDNVDNKPDFGDLVAMADDPGVSSLYLSATYMGYWNGAAWRAYIQGDGSFKFYIGATDYIEGTGGVVTIRGSLVADDIQTGNLSADRIFGGTLDFDDISRDGLEIITADIRNNAITQYKIGENEVRTSELYIDGSIVMNPTGGTNYNSISGCDYIKAGDFYHWIDLEHSFFQGAQFNWLDLDSDGDVHLYGEDEVRLDAGEDIVLDCGEYLSLYGTDGGSVGGLVSAVESMEIKFNGTRRRIAVFAT